MPPPATLPELTQKSVTYRRHLLEAIYHAGAGHTGGSLSCVDILNVLYNRILRVSPATFADPRRDRYVQSKGHSVEALYVVLADKGFFPAADLDTMSHYQSPYVGHPTRKVPGIEHNTGALGHGLPFAVGLALGAKLDSASSNARYPPPAAEDGPLTHDPSPFGPAASAMPAAATSPATVFQDMELGAGARSGPSAQHRSGAPKPGPGASPVSAAAVASSEGLDAPAIQGTSAVRNIDESAGTVQSGEPPAASAFRVFTLLGDGELAEGSNWEAAMAAAHYRLDNLTAIVDCNALQITGRTKDVMNHEPLRPKFEAFGWAVREVDGHDLAALISALEAPLAPGSAPSAVIARTTKGKGVSFMENSASWHHRVPTADELSRALAELGGAHRPDALSRRNVSDAAQRVEGNALHPQ